MHRPKRILSAALGLFTLTLCFQASKARAEENVLQRFVNTYKTTLAQSGKAGAPNQDLYRESVVLPPVDLRVPSLKDPDVELVFKPCRYVVMSGLPAVPTPFGDEDFEQLVLSSKSTNETLLELGVFVSPKVGSVVNTQPGSAKDRLEKLEIVDESTVVLHFKKYGDSYSHRIRYYGQAGGKPQRADLFTPGAKSIKISWARGRVPATLTMQDFTRIHGPGTTIRLSGFNFAYISALTLPGTQEQVLDSKVVREIHDLFFLRKDLNDPDVLPIYMMCLDQAYFNYVNRRLLELPVVISDALAPARDGATVMTQEGQVFMPVQDNTPRSRAFSKILLNAYETRLLREYNSMNDSDKKSATGKELRLLINRVLVDRLQMAPWDVASTLANTHVFLFRQSLNLNFAASNMAPAELGSLLMGETTSFLCPKPSPLLKVNVEELP